jgi:hypothetical protein
LLPPLLLFFSCRQRSSDQTARHSVRTALSLAVLCFSSLRAETSSAAHTEANAIGDELGASRLQRESLGPKSLSHPSFA